MPSAEADTPFCRLFVRSGTTLEALRSQIEASLPSCFGQMEVSWRAARNPYCAAGSEESPVGASPWSVEFDSDGVDCQAHEAFQVGVILLMRMLRDRGVTASAACDFETRIAAELGHN